MATKTKEKKPRHNPWKNKPEQAEQELAVESNHQEKTKPAMSCIDAAAKVLGESNEPMNTRQMIEAMAAKGYWTSPSGKTPAATLTSKILREMRKETSRFVKTGPGHYRLA